MNSLFQYYFTLKPLREAVLDFEAHAEGNLTDEELKKKQISKWELQRSKRCNPNLKPPNVVVAQLRLLFQTLITSNLAYVRPKEELIRLTLIDVKQEVEEVETKRRQSFMSNKSHPILDTDIPEHVSFEPGIENSAYRDRGIRAPASTPISTVTESDDISELEQLPEGPVEPEPPTAEDADYEFVDHESVDPTAAGPSDNKGPKTLNKENENTPTDGRRQSSAKEPLRESQEPNIMQVDSKEQEDVEMVDIKDTSKPITPPSSPPPIPQRPVQRRKSTWQPLKYGSQQDVTECITNCLSQLHAGFKPDEIAENGDHVDLFKK
jgi:ubiquitin carboxyl-terminal hydrolase 25